MKLNIVLATCALAIVFINELAADKPRPTSRIDQSSDQDSTTPKHQDNSETANRVHFTSDFFATPIEFKGDPESRKITSFQIICKSLNPKGEGQILIDTNDLQFNEFGDARKTTMKRASRHTFSLVAIEGSEHGARQESQFRQRSRSIYKLVFKKRFCDFEFFLNLPKSPLLPSKLVLANISLESDTKQSPRIAGAFQLVDLTSKNTIRGDYEIGEEIELQTQGLYLTPNRITGGITVKGKLGGAAFFSNDRNSVSLSDYGDVASQTLMGYLRHSVQLDEKHLKDPKNLGRRLFDVTGRDSFLPHKIDTNLLDCSLVVSPRISGDHRLLIKQDGEIAHVIRLKDLKWLRFAASLNSVKDKGVEKILNEIRSQCSNGFSFVIKEGVVSKVAILRTANDRVLQLIGELNTITELRLNDCSEITESGLKEIGKLKSLKLLSLRNTLATDDVLQEAGKLSQLNILLISHQGRSVSLSKITKAGISKLKSLKKLKTLSLSGTQLTDHAVDEIVGLKNLESFELVNTSITLDGLTKFSRAIPNCRVMFVNNQLPNTMQRINVMKRGTVVVISGHVSNQELAELKQHTPLLELSLPKNVSDESLRTISKLSSLEKLTVRNNRLITDTGIGSVSEIAGLQELSLGYCRQLTDESANHLVKLKKLIKLNVTGTKISDTAIARIKSALPNCQIER